MIQINKEKELCERILNEDCLFGALSERHGVIGAVHLFERYSDEEMASMLDTLLIDIKEEYL